MTKVTIIGATGSLGRQTTQTLLQETDAELVLFSRSADRLPADPRTTRIAASTSDTAALEQAVAGSELVFAALSGDLETMATQIVQAMKNVGAKRLVFISSYGIYGEIAGRPDESNGILRPYRKAADVIEKSGLDYTILRPGWFDNGNDTDYQLIPKGETIYSNDVSRRSIADAVKQMVLNKDLNLKANLGIVR